MSRLARTTKVLVGIAVSAGLLYPALRDIQPRAILSHLGQTHWSWFALAAAFNLAMLWARGFRWVLLFYPASQRGWPLVSATAIGFMANNVLPLRMGELVRGYLAARRGGFPFWTSMATLAVERVLDTLSILIILGAVVIAVPVPSWLETGAIILLLLAAMAMWMLILLRHGWGPLMRAITRIPRVGKALEHWLTLFSTGLGSLRRGPHLGALGAWTVLIWALNAGAVWAALRSGGLVLPASASLTVLAFTGIAVSIPSAPGYVGTLQFFIVQALAIYAVRGNEAVSVSFLFHAASYIPITLLGWSLLMVEGISLGGVLRDATAHVS